MTEDRRRLRGTLAPVRGVLLCLGLVPIAWAGLFRTEAWLLLLVTGLACLGLRHLVPRVTTKRTLKSALYAAALLGASTAFAVAICEAGARMLIPELVLGGARRTEMHPRRLHTLRPGRQGVGAVVLNDGSIGSYPFRISNQGLRDREYGPKESDELRILALGDSFVFGYGLRQDQTIPTRLEILLSEAFPDRHISVINGGSPGYGPWQELGFLIEKGFPLEPDLVILQVFPNNDIADTLIRDGVALRAHRTRLTQGRIRCLHYYTDWKMRLEAWLIWNSRFYRAASVWSDGAINVSQLLNRTRLFHNPAIPGIRPTEDRPWYIEVMLRDWYPRLAEGWRLFEADVLAIRDACQDRGIEFAVFCVPSGASLIDTVWNHCTGLSGNPEMYERGKEMRLAHAFFEREKLPYIPIDGALRNHPDIARLYYLRDGHFTVEGADMTARLLTDYLVAGHLSEATREKHAALTMHPEESPEASGGRLPCAP